MTLHDPAAIQAFFDAWDLYRRVIQHDYMFHRIIHEKIRDVVDGYPAARVLDLGSGDSSVMAGTLKGLDISGYTAVDLSGVALEHAQANLARADFRTAFHAADLLDFLRGSDADSHDVVVAGYTVHHFSGDEVAAFFEASRRVLSPGGTLLVYDVIRGESESREENLRRNHAWRTQTWTALSTRDLESVWDHVSAADFPKRLSELQAHARVAGFPGEPELLYEAPTGIHKLSAFRTD